VDSTPSTGQPAPEPELTTHHEHLGPNPWVGMALAVIVGVAVFWLLHRIRRAFGMR